MRHINLQFNQVVVALRIDDISLPLQSLKVCLSCSIVEKFCLVGNIENLDELDVWIELMKLSGYFEFHFYP